MSIHSSIMSSSQRQLSLNSQLRSIASSNKCYSKIGTNISQFFVQLKVKDTGDTSVSDRHNSRAKRMQEDNKVQEDGMLEEGRLKVIKSDLKRARERNSVKDMSTITEHLKQHKKRVARDLNNLTHADPMIAKKVKLERILPVQDIHANFKSPTRVQLQQYEAREDIQKPNASTYRPRFDFVLKKEGRPVSLPVLEENPGKQMKHEMFEKHSMVLCNRLADKLDRGYETVD